MQHRSRKRVNTGSFHGGVCRLEADRDLSEPFQGDFDTLDDLGSNFVGSLGASPDRRGYADLFMPMVWGM
jgi:hypothetical protein